MPGAGQRPLRVLEERVERKRQIFEHYKDALGDLPGIEFMPEASYGKSNRWLTVILISPDEFGADREQVRLAPEAENIEARPLWKPMHMQPVFDVLGCTALGTRYTGKARKAKGKYKARVEGGGVAEDLFNRGLCLLSGTAMTDSDLDRVLSVIRRCHKKSLLPISAQSTFR